MTNSSTSAAYIEPWLSGTHTDVPAVSRAVLHALDLAGDDVKRWTEGLSDLEIQAQPFGLMSVASQLKHMAGSIDRLLTYAESGQLSSQQLSVLKAEQTAGETLNQLLAALEASLGDAGGAQAVAHHCWRRAGARGGSHHAPRRTSGHDSQSAESPSERRDSLTAHRQQVAQTILRRSPSPDGSGRSPPRPRAAA
jgi:hypothetical protein